MTAKIPLVITNGIVQQLSPSDVLVAPLSLPAGTSSTPPISLVSGTLLTTPVQGSIEYNSGTFYITDSTSIQQVIATQAWVNSTNSTNIVSVTVNFNTQKTINTTFTVAGALTTQNIVMTPSLVMPSGLSQDELEMDTFICAAYVSAANTVQAIIQAYPGPVVGNRTFNLTIG